MYVCMSVSVCACICMCMHTCMHACLCMHVSMYVCMCVYVYMHRCMCVYACIMCVLLYVCMCKYAGTYICVHTYYTQSKLLSILHMWKKSPTLSLESKHPFMNIFCETCFTPNPPNLSPDTCQYLSWTMHPLPYTFKALIKSADVKRKTKFNTIPRE